MIQKRNTLENKKLDFSNKIGDIWQKHYNAQFFARVKSISLH